MSQTLQPAYALLVLLYRHTVLYLKLLNKDKYLRYDKILSNYVVHVCFLNLEK